MNSGEGTLDAVGAALMPWAAAGDTTTATKTLASRAEAAPAAASAVAGARERLARHAGALALARSADDLLGAGRRDGSPA